MSRSRLQDLIKEGHATLNGKAVKAGATLKCGDAVSLTVPDVAEVEIKAQNIPLTILYEDSDIVVLDNLGSHKTEAALSLISAVGAQTRFLPPIRRI